MKNHILKNSHRLTTLLGILLLSGLFGACQPNSDEAANDPDADNTSVADRGMVLNHDGSSITANTSIEPVNPMFIGGLKTFHLTILAGWSDPKSDQKFGLITARLILKGDSETEVSTGAYTLVEDSQGMGMLSDEMSGALKLQGGALGLPESLVATSGTLNIKTIDFHDKSLHGTSMDFEGTFKNPDDTGSATTYKLSGTINAPTK